MRKLFVLLAAAFLLSLPSYACAEGMIRLTADAEATDGLATFYTSASAADRLYLCEAYQHRIYAISPDGALATADASRSLEGSEGSDRYLSVLSLASDGANAYAVCMTVCQEPSRATFEGAGLYALEPSGEIGERVCALDLSDAIVLEAEGQEARNCVSALLRDQRLHLLFDDGEGSMDESQSRQLFVSFELPGGEKTVQRTTGVFQLIDARGDEVFCARAAEDPAQTLLQIVNIRTGEAREVNRLSGGADRPRNIVYDQAQNFAFYSVANQVWGIPEIGREAQLLALLPARRPSALYFAGGERLYACDLQNAYILNVDWSAQIETRTFVASSGNSLLNAYAQLHPELEIQAANLEVDALIDAALTQSDTPDLFSMRSDHPAFSALKARGYLAPLEDAEIRQFVEALHPDIQRALYSGGALCAVPTGMELRPVLGVNGELWQRLGLGETPKSWPALLDFVESWCRSGGAGAAVRLMDVASGAEARACLVRRLTDDYEAYRAKQPDMGYDTEIFRDLMGRLEAIPWENLDASDASGAEEALFQYQYFPTLQIQGQSAMSPMALSIEEGGEAILTASLNIVAVNPRSQNQEIALDYIRYAIGGLDPVARIEMCPAENEPLEREDHAQAAAELSASIEALNQRIAAEADEARRRELEWELQAAEEALQRENESPWRVSPEAIAQFRASCPRISMLNEAGLDEDTLNVLQISQGRLISGEIDLDAFISEVDRRIRMQAMESPER